MKPTFTRCHVRWLVLLLAGAILFTGCVGVIPIPASSTKVASGRRLTPEAVAFIQPGLTTRAAVISCLGSNYLALPYHRAIAYSWEMEGGGFIWWWSVACLAGGAWDGGYEPGGWRAYFIAFDAQGVVTATAFNRPSTSYSLHHHLSRWVAQSPGPPLVAANP